MASSDKKYCSLDSSEKLGFVSNASRHTAATVSDVEMDLDDEIASTTGQLGRCCCLPITDYLRSYRPVEFLVCLGFFLVTNVHSSWLTITPHQRPMPVQYLEGSGEYVRNLTNNAEFDGETIPYELLILLSGVFPLVLQVVLSLCRGSSSPIHEAHQTFCVYFVAWSLNMIACEFVKNYVGYLRPLFFQFCEPTDDYSECTAGGDTIRKSFPSGHSSTSFCGMTILALYIHNRFGVYSKRCFRQIRHPHKKGDVDGDESTLWRLTYEEDSGLLWARLMSIVALLPLFVALWIAASRIRDNKHFPADVLAGALIGATLGRYSHGLWFV
uniref:Phosphatidic acid phosphatase type 2/haloperoxidase domain-containing protein n=1 Tax=Amphora coffeiformis TaxID=265554 RepID=A0A7S3LF07_9STRA